MQEFLTHVAFDSMLLVVKFLHKTNSTRWNPMWFRWFATVIEYINIDQQ
jgi:hypothetical protein